MTSPADTAAHRPACFDPEAPLAMLCPWCRGGADAPLNMQWQTIEQGKAKDKWE